MRVHERQGGRSVKRIELGELAEEHTADHGQDRIEQSAVRIFLHEARFFPTPCASWRLGHILPMALGYPRKRSIARFFAALTPPLDERSTPMFSGVIALIQGDVALLPRRIGHLVGGILSVQSRTLMIRSQRASAS